MTAPVIAALLAATAGGAALAAAGQPACHWSSLGAIALKTRLAMLKTAPPGRRRSRLAALGLAGLMSAAALTAYAAAPSGPDALPGEVVGVIGSGDQLSLKVAQDQKIRTVKLGAEYRDGWTLDALTTSTASLSKEGQRREIGLNPTGALASAAPGRDPSKVEIAGDTIEAHWAAETAIMNEYKLAVEASGGSNSSFDAEQMARLLGPARLQAFYDNDNRLGELMQAKARADAVARGDFNTVRAYDHLAVVGPDSFVVPAGMSHDQAAKALGLTSSIGYSIDFATNDPAQAEVMIKCFKPATPNSALGCKTI
ncbi:MAG: hypothetical protein JWM33_408 [Caulobacteraceae bacterium]|nr:hypothetical protein [Caulobacteraceae bacterium]